jgi:LysR family transcriptional regulator, benzoate and cis,cis-muconate-responsive activator of ben and cat genes
VELRQLRAFVAVATEGHFGRAAARLNLTQPGLTLRIQALERELGAHLLERSAREVQLTAAGSVLLPHARSLLRIEDRALRDLKDQAEGIAGRLRISYLSHGAVTFPGQLVAEFRRRYPTVQVETTVGHTSLNAQQLLDGTVDAAFISPGFLGSAGIHDQVVVRLLSRQKLMVAMNPNHHLAKLEQVPVKALGREPLIMPAASPYQVIGLALTQWLTRHVGTELNVVAHDPPDQALEAVARSTSLITFTNAARAANAPLPGVAYRSLSPELLSDFGLVYFRDDESRVLANLVRLIDEMAGEGPGDLPEGSELLSLPDVSQPNNMPGPPGRPERVEPN